MFNILTFQWHWLGSNWSKHSSSVQVLRPMDTFSGDSGGREGERVVQRQTSTIISCLYTKRLSLPAIFRPLEHQPKPIVIDWSKEIVRRASLLSPFWAASLALFILGRRCTLLRQVVFAVANMLNCGFLTLIDILLTIYSPIVHNRASEWQLNGFML